MLGFPNKNVPVAVVDTGVNWMHPDLKNQIYENPARKVGYPGVDDDGNGKIDDIRGWDFTGDGNSPEDNNPEDYNGHGTFIAGLIAAEHDRWHEWRLVKLRRILPIRVGIIALGTVYRWILEPRSMRFQEESQDSELESVRSLRESSLAEKACDFKIRAGWCVE